MLKYILKRVVLIVFTLFIILSLAYILMQFTVNPHDRTYNYFIPKSQESKGTNKYTWEDAVDYGVQEKWGDKILKTDRKEKDKIEKLNAVELKILDLVDESPKITIDKMTESLKAKATELDFKKVISQTVELHIKKLEDAEEKVTTLKAELKVAEEKVAELEAALKAPDADVAKLEAELKAANTSVSGFKGKVAEAKAAVNALKDTKLGTAVDELEAAKSEAELETAKAKVSEAVTSMLVDNLKEQKILEVDIVRIPIMERYFNWLFNAIQGKWGVSAVLEIGENPWVLVTEYIPYTIRLNILPLLISTPLGFLFGIIAALRKNKPIDYVISLAVMICISVPSFVFVTLLMINANKMGLPIQFSPADKVTWKDYIIPTIALSVGPIASLTRITRAELTEVLTSEYLLLARTKGLNRFQATLRHALRNSLLPLVPSIIGSFVGIMFGSLVIEQIYGVKGVGQLLINSINKDKPDHDVAMVTLTFYTVINLITILFVDLAYGVVDPRIRMGAR